MASEASLTVMVAAAAGFLYFLSPCVWPLYPAFISHLAGEGEATGKEADPEGRLLQRNWRRMPLSRSRILVRAFAFVIGFTLVFVAMGATASAVGQWLVLYQPLLRRLAGLLIIAFGLMMLGWLYVPWTIRIGAGAQPAAQQRGTVFASFLLGCAFGIGWTPCVGPVLGSIIALASLTARLQEGVLLLASFAAGLAVPFLLCALLLDRLLPHWRSLARFMPIITRAGGVLLIVLGVLVYTNTLVVLAGWLFYV